MTKVDVCGAPSWLDEQGQFLRAHGAWPLAGGVLCPVSTGSVAWGAQSVRAADVGDTAGLNSVSGGMGVQWRPS